MSAFMTKTFKLVAGAVMAAGLLGGLLGASHAFAEGNAEELKDPGFSFEGPFGTFDQGELQRGFKVYREVCSPATACT